MKTEDMRKKLPADLKKHAESLKEALAKGSIERLTKSANNTVEMKKIRKEIAQSLTIATELEKTAAESKDK